MPLFTSIYEVADIENFLMKRNLTKQYKKAKSNILQGYITGTKISLKEPKHQGIRYFRINKQYRALGKVNDKGDLVVYKIDDHQ